MEKEDNTFSLAKNTKERIIDGIFGLVKSRHKINHFLLIVDDYSVKILESYVTMQEINQQGVVGT